jgi:hypothetical protein
VKFTIEIVTAGNFGSEASQMRRMPFSALNPLAAKKEANRLLASRKGVMMVRVLNARNELLLN